MCRSVIIVSLHSRCLSQRKSASNISHHFPCQRDIKKRQCNERIFPTKARQNKTTMIEERKTDKKKDKKKERKMFETCGWGKIGSRLLLSHSLLLGCLRNQNPFHGSYPTRKNLPEPDNPTRLHQCSCFPQTEQKVPAERIVSEARRKTDEYAVSQQSFSRSHPLGVL